MKICFLTGAGTVERNNFLSCHAKYQTPATARSSSSFNCEEAAWRNVCFLALTESPFQRLYTSRASNTYASAQVCGI